MSNRSDKILYSGFLLGIVFTIAISCADMTAGKNCDQYKNGKFYMFERIENAKVSIERRDSMQIETNEKTGIITGLKINWTGACEYELTLKYRTKKDSSVTDELQKIIEEMRNIPLQIKILSSNKNYYVFEAKKNGISLELKDTVWLVK